MASTLNKAISLMLVLLLLHSISGHTKDLTLNTTLLGRLQKLNSIVGARINGTLKNAFNNSKLHENGEFKEQFQRLTEALDLPLSHLAEKIETFHAYQAYDTKRVALEEQLQAQLTQNWSSHSEADAVYKESLRTRLRNAFNSSNEHKIYLLKLVKQLQQGIFRGIQELDQNQTLPESETVQLQLRQMNYTEFEKKVLKLLKRLGLYNPFAARVFMAIFSDEAQLKKLKQKLMELDNDDNSDNDLNIWDIIFGLF